MREPLFRKYATSQEAWEGINQLLFLEESQLRDKNQGRSGNMTIAHDVSIFISKAWVDPKIDFANLFGYRIQKWTSLVNNYVDLDYLDLVKADINSRESKNQKLYTVTLPFKNHHKSGKGCLISITFTRRMDWDIPILVFHVRASEVTKRLLLDFLLVQRMAEYIYGTDQTVSIQFTAPIAYITAEAFTMYHTHKSLTKLAKKHLGESPLQPMQEKILDTLKKFKTIDVESLSYKVHRRSVRQLQRDENGIPLSGDRPLVAENLTLIPKPIDYPDDVLTERHRKEYRKKLKQSIKK